MKNINHITDLALQNKRVLLRADLNVPIENGTIINDFKLEKIIPTIDYILHHGGSIILLTHLGRPQHHEPSLSAKQLLPWFEKRGYTIQFAATIEQARTCTAPIALLENLRFFPGEQTDDTRQANDFANQLADLGDVYVNDAFGVLHRTDTSVTMVPEKFDFAHKACGLLVAQELQIFNTLIHGAAHPFVLILGGQKAATKIPIIENLLDTVDTILLCPALVFTFLNALKKPVGKSLVDTHEQNICLKILEKAHTKKVTILFPLDYLVAHETINGTLSITKDSTIDCHSVGVSIGPKTIKLFVDQIKNAKTIFFNGAIGFAQRPETLSGMQSLIESMADTNATTVIAGGDSVAATYAFNKAAQIQHLSTGGGAALHTLSGKKLPGIEALKKRTKTQ